MAATSVFLTDEEHQSAARSLALSRVSLYLYISISLYLYISVLSSSSGEVHENVKIL